MADVLVREASRRDSPSCLLTWAEEGWVPTCPPEDVGHTDAGDRVLRFILVRVLRGRGEPSTPGTPHWHLDTVVLRGPSDRSADS